MRSSAVVSRLVFGSLLVGTSCDGVSGIQEQDLQSPHRWYPSQWHKGARVPRFLDCEGDAWSPNWRLLRESLQVRTPAALLHSGFAPDVGTVALAELLIESSGDYTGIMRGYNLFARRLARDLGSLDSSSQDGRVGGYDTSTAADDGFMSDSVLDGFCLYGLIAALFVRMLELVAGVGVPVPEARESAIENGKFALELLSPGLGLDFLESSSWPVRSVDLRLLVEGLAALRDVSSLPDSKVSHFLPWRQPLEAPQRLNPTEDHHLAVVLAWPTPMTVLRLEGSEFEAIALLKAKAVLSAPDPKMLVVGIGDHATATLDAALMVRASVQAAVPSASVRLAVHGLACPAEEAGRHHCRLRCHVLGVCGVSADALAEWLEQHALGMQTGDGGLQAGGSEALAQALVSLPGLRDADLLVCSHPVSLCFLAFMVLWQPRGAELAPLPMLVHLSSTLLYGAPGCTVCSGGLRNYESPEALRYMQSSRELLTGQLSLVALAEGAVLSAQLKLQLGVTVPSCPALALYLDSNTYLDGMQKRSTILVTRARLFNHPAGFFMRCMLSEFAITNGPVADATRGHFWFAEAVGGSSGSEDTWKSWTEMSTCKAAFFIPSDIHQRTFIELYRMLIPMFMPNAEWFLRLPLIAPFGTFAYNGSLPAEDQSLDTAMDSAQHGVPFSFDPNSATARAVFHWYHYSDYAHFPHVSRCNSIPDLLGQLSTTDFEAVSHNMQSHYALLARGATAAFARALTALIP